MGLIRRIIHGQFFIADQKTMLLKELLHITIKTGKFIGNAKAVKNVADLASANQKERKHQRQEEQKKQKEREERRQTIKNIRNRNIFETAAIYMFGTLVACYISSFGWVQMILVALFYLMHMSSMHDLKGSVDLRREWIFTVISIACMVFLA